MKTAVGVLVFLFVLLPFRGTAVAATFDVSTAEQLQIALTTAQTNGQHDLIRIAESPTPYTGNFTYEPAAGENFDVTIVGGWSADFSIWDPDPTRTVLDGNSAGRVLSLLSPNLTMGNIGVEAVTLAHGAVKGTGSWGGGLLARTYPPGEITVRGNIVKENSALSGAGGLMIDGSHAITLAGNGIMQNLSGPDPEGNLNLPFAGGAYVICSGACTIVNNLIVGNNTTDSVIGGGKGGGIMVLASAGDIALTNNTILANNAYTYGGGVYVGASGPTAAVHFSLNNNIIRGNTTTTGWRGDEDIQNGICEPDPPATPWGHSLTIDHNDYTHLGDWTCSIAPTVTGNLDVDPVFEVGDDGYPLQGTSPLVDAGNNAAPGLPGTDSEGQPRVFAFKDRGVKVVDIGWDEYFDGDLGLDAPEAWVSGRPVTIGFSCANVGPSVDLLLARGSRFDGRIVRTIAAGVPCSQGSVVWTVPVALPDGDDYAVVALASEYPAVQRGQGVAIRHVNLAAPNGGQVWRQGSSYAIKWWNGRQGGAYVKLELLHGGTPVRTIAARTLNDGVFTWKVPYSLPPDSTYAVRVTGLGKLTLSDDSDGLFTILPAVRVTAPNGGQSLTAGSKYRITWRYTGSPGRKVKIDLYRDGAFDSTIAPGVPIGSYGRGGYTWRIPATLPAASTYRVRIQASPSANCFDLSDGNFAVLSVGP